MLAFVRSNSQQESNASLKCRSEIKAVSKKLIEFGVSKDEHNLEAPQVSDVAKSTLISEYTSRKRLEESKVPLASEPKQPD